MSQPFYSTAWRQSIGGSNQTTGSGDLEHTGERNLGALDGNSSSPKASELRSDSWEVLQGQIKAAQITGSFIFAHRKLDAVTSTALSQHLRFECTAKFVDLSALGNWKAASAELASAVEGGLRSARSLVLDGNDIGSSSDMLERWCVAISEHPGLQHICLRDAGMDDAALKRVSQMIRDNIVLFSIDIGFNRVTDAGVESLVKAIEDNQIILEVILDGCDVSSGTQARLSAALQRNRDRFPNPTGCLAGLRNLRQAKAEAVTVTSIRTCGLRDAKLSSQTPHTDVDPQSRDGAREVASSLLSMFAAMEPGELPFILDGESQEEADGVFFDAGSGATTELNNRCEAGWRYTAADREGLHELRRKTADIKACRKHEKKRGDEAVDRIAGAQIEFRAKWAPTEDHIYQLKEELAFEISSTKDELKANMKVKMELQGAQKDLEETQRDHCCYHLGAQSLENNLKIRNREVQEYVDRLQSELNSLQESVDFMEKENEKCRRMLHAARFETETERFVPKAALEQAANQRAAEEETRARREAETKQLHQRQPPVPRLEFRGGS